MDALDDDQVPRPAPQDRAAVDALRGGKVVARQGDGPAGDDVGELSAEELGVHARRGLQVNLPGGDAALLLLVKGVEVVVHGQRVRLAPPGVQALLELEGGGGLAAARGAGEEDQGVFFPVFVDVAGKARQHRLVVRVGAGDKARRIGRKAAGDLVQRENAHGVHLLSERGPRREKIVGNAGNKRGGGFILVDERVF